MVPPSKKGTNGIKEQKSFHELLTQVDLQSSPDPLVGNDVSPLKKKKKGTKGKKK